MVSSSAVARAALADAARGWAVVPVHTVVDGRCSCGRVGCPSPAKHPRVRWQRFEQARPGATQVEAWWRRWPDANVGIVTGGVSGVVVLDVDRRHGGEESLAELERTWGVCGATVESVTGGGGRHLWFAASGGERLTSGPIAPGCDVKAEGGVAVAPPSVHASGGRYRWRPGRAPDEIALLPPPAWLRALASPEPRALPGSGDRSGVPARTEQEQAEFAAAWARAGLMLAPGDHTYLCPFHDDHHPSLHVDADGCRWMCFGCGRKGGIGALRRALRETDAGRARARIAELSDGSTTQVTLPGEVEVDVVGESAHQDALLSLTGGRRSYGGVDAYAVATLGADPAAPLDPGAVEVRIAGRPVGRLRRETARRYRTFLAYAAHEYGEVTCAARILGGWDRGRGDVGAFGVRVLLPELDEPDDPPGRR